jgi:hypothetical protein
MRRSSDYAPQSSTVCKVRPRSTTISAFRSFTTRASTTFIKRIDVATDVLPSRGDEPAVDPANPIFAEYGYNALESRLRSHRDVASRYYADVTWESLANGARVLAAATNTRCS